MDKKFDPVETRKQLIVDFATYTSYLMKINETTPAMISEIRASVESATVLLKGYWEMAE